MSPKSMALILAFGCVLALYPGSTARGVELPSPEELADLAPVFGGLIQDYRSYKVVGVVETPMMSAPSWMNFRVLYREPDRYYCLWSDADDGTPIMLISNQTALIYDPQDGIIIIIKKINPFLALRNINDEIKYNFGYRDDKDTAPEIVLDIKSLFSVTSINKNVDRIDADTFRLTYTTQKESRLTAWINRAKSCPFERVEITHKGDKKPILAIEKIEVDLEIPEERFSFPSISRLESIMPVKDLQPNDSYIAKFGVGARCARTAYIRQMANHPELRDAIKIPGVVEIDWEKVRENDRKFAKPLRELLQSYDQPTIAPRKDAAAPLPGREAP